MINHGSDNPRPFLITIDTNTCDHKIIVRDSFLRRGRENRNRGMEEAAAAAELESLQIDILRRISALESSILPESSSPSLPEDESQTVSRLSAILRSGGVKDFSFKRVAPDYYDWPLESRRDVLGASSVDHLCKSIVLVRQSLMLFEVMKQCCKLGFC